MGAKVFLLLTFLALMLLPAGHGRAEQIDCLMCHPNLAEGKVVHAAVQMGCTVCHVGVDASDIPHKFTGEKGLSAAPPDLCFQCHSKDEFSRKVLHAPVAGGMCTFCHTPHAGPNESLLTTGGNALCLQCHNGIDKKPHAISRFTSLGHKLSGAADPLRKGKPLGCLSCHLPHSSDWVKLFRYEAQDASGICKHCHEFLQ